MEDADLPKPWSRTLALALALGVVGLAMGLPMALIGAWTEPPPSGSGVAATGAAATLGVIFRASARNVLRSGVMMGVRATSRTATRRVARALLRSFMGLVLPAMALPPALASERRRPPELLSVGLGFVALVASFGGVLSLLGPEAQAALTMGCAPALAAVFAALPMLMHTAILRALAPSLGLGVRQETSIDALLLQGYFTGAGGFLPLASDVLLEGPPRGRALASAAVLLSLLALHLALSGLSSLAPAPALDLLAALTLLYAFVFVFPFKPLDGGNLWAWDPRAWLFVFGLTTAAFMTRLPEVWIGVL